MEANIIGYFVVFLARVTDVSLSTVRILLLMRGKRLLAALVGFGEVLVYIVALRYIFSSLNDWTSLIFYALGFSTGILAGTWLEEKMALGFLIMRVITQKDAPGFADYLRQNGFGVTLFPCQGREGCYHLINIVCERRKLAMLEQLVFSWDKSAFVTVSDTRAIRGGHI